MSTILELRGTYVVISPDAVSWVFSGYQPGSRRGEESSQYLQEKLGKNPEGANSLLEAQLGALLGKSLKSIANIIIIGRRTV